MVESFVQDVIQVETEKKQVAEREKRSPTLGKLASALAKAQGEMENAEKDVKGNYGKYATLASTWDAIRGPLSKNEIAVYQRPLIIEGRLMMCTMLIHSSGEFLDDGELEMIFDRTGGRLTPMQAMGGAVTYARRYTLQGATGIAPADDDDGVSAGTPQKASHPLPPVPHAKKNQQPIIRENLNGPAPKKYIDRINELCMDHGITENILHYLINKGYGRTIDKVTTAEVLEIGEMLHDPDINEAMILAVAEQMKDERELKEKGIL